MNAPSTKPLYVVLARKIDAYKRCSSPSANASQASWAEKHEAYALKLVKAYMPSGAGIDMGTTLQIGQSTENELVFTFAYHHMDESGGYDGWTHHRLTVKSSLAFGFKLAISGPDRNGIKEYLHEVYQFALITEVDEFNTVKE